MPLAAGEIQSAGLSAKSSVSASSAVKGAHTALTAYADAKSAVDENLCFNINAFYYPFYFLSGHFTGKHNS